MKQLEETIEQLEKKHKIEIKNLENKLKEKDAKILELQNENTRLRT
ncbi:10041_t:CDS:1, partial [Racocetra persica]